MPENALTPKNVILGPLGREIGNFPLRFAKSVMFGGRPSREALTKINSGSASLLQLDCGPVAVTCHHVVQCYRERLEAGEQCVFQIGSCRIDPLAQCISESQGVDLAVLDLTWEQAAKITGDGWMGSQFFSPKTWPPEPVEVEEDVAFGGFPGQWRKMLDHDSLEFASYSQCTLVSDVANDSFICQGRREFWVNRSGLRDVESLKDYGGISGGPAFVWRKLHWDFAGVVREYFPHSDAVRIAHAELISSNGTIGR